MAENTVDEGRAAANRPTELVDAEDPYRRGQDLGRELALTAFARAWVDRWRALGGDFSMSWNADGTFRGTVRGIPEPSFWEPPAEQNPLLAPHQWILEDEHQVGAAKMLDSLLTLVPGLSDAVYEIGARQCLSADTSPEREA